MRQNRLIAAGRVSDSADRGNSFIFQPNEYDNNKLIYVWFLLCLAPWRRITRWTSTRGCAGWRPKGLAALFLIACFLSAGLTVAREAVSDYQAYGTAEIAVGDYVKENTPQHSVFLTGTEHLNPVASLAGRTIVCGSDLYLYYHGFNTTTRHNEVKAFYENPADNLSLLTRYGVQYVYVSPSEYYSYDVDEEALRSLFTLVYEGGGGNYLVFSVAQPRRDAG